MSTVAFRSTGLLPSDRGGGRAAASGPLLKRSQSSPLPSVHEEILDELGKAQPGDQAPFTPPGKAVGDLSWEH